MHSAFSGIKKRLEDVIDQLASVMPVEQSFGNAQNGWMYSGLTRSDLIEEAISIAWLIDSQAGDEVGEFDGRLKEYDRRLQLLCKHNIKQIGVSPGAAQAITSYLVTMQGLRGVLMQCFYGHGNDNPVANLKKLVGRIRNMEAIVNGLDPRAASLNEMVERIEQAYKAADDLPADLESLSEARRKISEIAKGVSKDQAEVSRVREAANEIDKKLKKSVDDAKSALDRCETAYSAATSVGLAAAFSERSKVLSQSMWFWVVGLVASLVAGSYFGSGQLHSLSELFKVPNASASVIFLNLLLSILSVGAPVWFAWLATKQVGQRFRLAEDYAFKASVSRAYEGFRRETARFDKDMEARLLSSALNRLDELPLRLIEADSHGSPWHELASSEAMKQAMKSVPGFAGQVKDLAGRAIDAIAPSKTNGS